MPFSFLCVRIKIRIPDGEEIWQDLRIVEQKEATKP